MYNRLNIRARNYIPRRFAGGQLHKMSFTCHDFCTSSRSRRGPVKKRRRAAVAHCCSGRLITDSRPSDVNEQETTSCKSPRS